MEESRYPEMMTEITSEEVSHFKENGDYIELLKTIIYKA